MAGSKDDGDDAVAAVHSLASAELAISADLGILGAEIAAARAYRAQAKSANTLRAYASDWRQFEGWCWARHLDPLPARVEAVATYLASLARAGRADSTVTRHMAAIGWQHRQAG